MDCECLIHPFQNDPGTSQSQRVMDSLLAGAAKIDARTLADLLNYFVQMSRHINYYDLKLNVNDWQPFFKNSVPFTLASIIKFPVSNTETNLDLYRSIFDKKPSPAGLQLCAFSIYYRFINNINNWQLILRDSSLPIAANLDELIKNKLQAPVKQFIKYSNTAVKTYGINRIDFLKLSENPVWGLDQAALSATDTSFSESTVSARKRIINLYTDFSTLVTVFTDAVKTLSAASEKNLEVSFIPLKEELQKKHSPHLALLFAFLNMFRQLQNDLNQYTRKHLDYFYKEILQFKAEEAVPDKANVVFEIQKALKNYLIKKGIRVKDGKDVNKQEILFALDDDIVVTQTSIADKRTLFVNNQNAHAQTYVEGVYMAPVAEMADGVEKEFSGDPKNFPTLGAHYSKYIDPETKLVKPYPSARLGFILASPVLFLQAGSTRTIDISLPCELNESICSDIATSISNSSKDCCNDKSTTTITDTVQYPDFYKADKFYKSVVFNDVNRILSDTYYYINEDIIKEAQRKGISGKLADELREFFLLGREETLCYCPTRKRKFEGTVVESVFTSTIAGLTDGERQILTDLIKPRRSFNFLFSGEKDWLEPSSIDLLELLPANLPAPGTSGYPFNLHIVLKLNPDKGAVTFYNKDVLLEDFGTTDPLVKIQLDDKIKFTGISLADIAEPSDNKEDCCTQDKSCCLLKEEADGDVSLYHFFRNVLIGKVEDADIDKPVISVDVCGLKNFIVQNDESVMDVNAPVYPFGTRPEIIDFDVVNPQTGDKNLSGPNFFIGSKEILFKKWNEICINLNWKDKPVNFNDYYKAYIVRNNYHDCADPHDNTKDIYGLNECDFEVNIALLENGNWLKENGTSADILPDPNPSTHDRNRHLFNPGACNAICNNLTLYDYSFHVKNSDFDGTRKYVDFETELLKYKADSRSGFLRFNLQNQDFLSKDYAFVLARQMMAFGRFPTLIDGAVYLNNGIPAIFDISLFFGNIGPIIIQIASDVVNSAINGVLNDLIQIITNKIDSSINTPLLNSIIARCISLLDNIATLAAITIPALFGGLDVSTLTPVQQAQVKTLVKDFVSDLFVLLNTDLTGIEDELKTAIRNKFNAILTGFDLHGIFGGIFGTKQVIIPNEPWTPVISNISLDYSAKATIQDIDLVHLYPYYGTYKQETINLQPTLFPTFCDEGSLFLGLKDLVPGDNLNILFQLAEATSDSESDKETVFWHYLDSNLWKPLRTGFEVLDDATKNLTSSGIIKLALPANMTSDNTVMPKGLHWIKASIPKNSGSVSETLGILSQAVQVIFTNDEANDKSRLSKPLLSGNISKLEVADASVKSVSQPYDSFGGLVPEIEQQFYVRVSETLRHKGRAIQAFDYERLALQAFPQLFKVKCINHSFGLNAHEYSNDFPYAGGYVLLAVIPDLNKLKAGNSFEPKLPVSIIEDIDAYIRKRTSPFVRFRTMNPRYEKINFCLKIRLLKGKDENYYKEQVKKDIREFLAPWAVGDYYKLTFGQCVYRSDIIRFLETRDYMDFIGDLKMGSEKIALNDDLPRICPDTPRSILIAGDIEVCIDKPDCDSWGNYYPCPGDKDPIFKCDTNPEKISDYCKKKKV